MGAEKETFDFLVIGAGMAGASIAAELSKNANVLIAEMEAQPGYHTTGRSAALFVPHYGPAPVRALTRASGHFLQNPPQGFVPTNLLSPRSMLLLARTGQTGMLQEVLAEQGQEGMVEEAGPQKIHEIQPLLREGYAVGGLIDRGCFDIDVHALHQGYLRMARLNGARLVTNARICSLTRTGNVWDAEFDGKIVRASVIVNAAGAWADEVGNLAGAETIGLMPKRRTGLIIEAPEGIDCTHMPATGNLDETFYLKPDGGRLMISPANEDPEPPCDVQPDEMDIAICIDRIEAAFNLNIRRIENKWAGLRSFVADKCPVAGYSSQVDGFFWLAGQGGYGIQMAPALARLAAASANGKPPPQDIIDQGLDCQAVNPARLTS